MTLRPAKMVLDFYLPRKIFLSALALHGPSSPPLEHDAPNVAGLAGSMAGSIAGGVGNVGGAAYGGLAGSMTSSVAGGAGGVANNVMAHVTPSRLAGGMASWRGRLADVVAPVEVVQKPQTGAMAGVSVPQPSPAHQMFGQAPPSGGSSVAQQQTLFGQSPNRNAAHQMFGEAPPSGGGSASDIFGAPSPQQSPMLTSSATPPAHLGVVPQQYGMGGVMPQQQHVRGGQTLHHRPPAPASGNLA